MEDLAVDNPDISREPALRTSPNTSPHHGTLVLRRALPGDQPAIESLVRSERLNPTGLQWWHFVVAVDPNGLAGAVQLREHADGTRELGSLVVRPELRGQGLSAQLIDLLLRSVHERVLLITHESMVPYFARWGFSPLAAAMAPRPLRRNLCLGRLGRLVSWVKGLPARRLLILERLPVRAHGAPGRSPMAPVVRVQPRALARTNVLS
jgi:N-acetylglutamate synthase-like GNAT family acetyltransferase